MTQTYQDVVAMRMQRRDFLRGAALFGAAAILPKPSFASFKAGAALQFTEITKANTPTIQLPEGYESQAILRWGQPLLKNAPEFDPDAQTPEAQAKQFGFNCDFVGYFTQAQSDNPLLCVNHEYVNPHLMFAGLEKGSLDAISPIQHRVCMEALGVSVAELEKTPSGSWALNQHSVKNRRITATTPMAFSGPVAGHARVQTSADTQGRNPVGTFANCAGGITPWGTYLTCEENFNMVFRGALPEGHKEAVNHTRCGVGTSDKAGWGLVDTRFDISREPNEPNRFGWVVEIDPHDPTSTPIKHSAVGRFKHECATCTTDPDGRLVVYSGDDEMFEYLYKFVSAKAYKKGAHGLSASVLDSGTLYAAKFNENGTLNWLPLVHGKGPLTEENDFDSQADVLIEARRAAELMGATAMDRPEDIEVHPETGEVFVALTNNVKRTSGNVANPRAANPLGHILRIKPAYADGAHHHAYDAASWDIYIMGGNPDVPEQRAYYPAKPSENGWLSCPDNLAIDPVGHLWIATDGQPKTIGKCDSLYGCALSGPDAGRPRLFMNVPEGAETTGPRFAPDGKTLFVSVQHPSEHASRRPRSGWPDFTDGMPPRPSVVAIQQTNGKKVGYA